MNGEEEENHPSAAKADTHFCAIYGTAKAVPFQNSAQPAPFTARLKPCPFKTAPNRAIYGTAKAVPFQESAQPEFFSL
jgi:hypothetical protein